MLQNNFLTCKAYNWYIHLWYKINYSFFVNRFRINLTKSWFAVYLYVDRKKPMHENI